MNFCAHVLFTYIIIKNPLFKHSQENSNKFFLIVLISLRFIIIASK